MREIHVGIVGCGGIANGKHLPSLAQLPYVKVVAFCDIIEERAQKAAKEYGTEDARVYTDYQEMLSKEGPDLEAVHVCTPNRSHSPITVAALDSGRHVLCEKPMAIDVAGAEAMLEASKRNGKILTIGYQTRNYPQWVYLKNAIEHDELGEIYYARALALRRRAVPTWGVFLNEHEQGGGPLIDIGTHALDLTLWLMNNYEPAMVVGSSYKKLSQTKNAANAWGPWDPEKFTVEDSAFRFIRFKNGATVVLESAWALNTLEVREAQCILCGTKAGADNYDGLRINGEKYGRTYVTKPEIGDDAGVAFFDGEKGATPPVIEASLFYSAIINGTELRVKPEQALVVTKILAAIYESDKTGQPVYFD